MEVERRMSTTTTTTTISCPASIRAAAMAAAAGFQGKRAAIARRASVSVDRTRSGVDATSHHPHSPTASSSPSASLSRRRMSHAVMPDQQHLQWLKRQRRESVVYLQWDWEEHRNNDRLCALLASQLSLSRKKSVSAGAETAESVKLPAAFLLPGQEECVLEDAPTMEGNS